MVATTATTTPFDAKDVNDQVNKTISQDGLLMRMAKANGEQYAAGRGLSNSSIGAEASQRAIVDAALPIASQNAGQAWKSDESRIDRSHQLTMQGNQFGHEKGMAELQYKNSLGLLDAEGQQRLKELGVQSQYQKERDQLLHKNSLGMLDAEGQQRLKELGVQNQFTSQRDSTLFKYDQQNKATDFANSLKTMSEQQKYDLQKLNAQTAASKDLAAQQQQYTLTNTAKQVAANTQGMYLDAINGLTSTFGDQVAAIQASAMKAEDKKTAVNSLIESQNAMLKFYQSTYQNMSTIKDDWINVDVQTLPSGTIANVK